MYSLYEERFEVQAVIAHKPDPREKGKYLYLVNWKEYADEDNTWERVDNFDDRICIQEYWKRLSVTKELQCLSKLTHLPYTINGGKNEFRHSTHVQNTKFPTLAEDVDANIQ